MNKSRTQNNEMYLLSILGDTNIEMIETQLKIFNMNRIISCKGVDKSLEIITNDGEN